MSSQIISASRRSDIPAFYGDWFMQQVNQGYCDIANPFNHKQVSRIDLRPEAVDCFVFWTKYPVSLLPYLFKLEKMGYPFYFLFTLNAYDTSFEKQLPAFIKRIGMFKKLASLIGSERVIWRYDPIIISQQTNFEYHLRNFQAIAESLRNCTRKVIISFYDDYAKTRKRLQRYEIVKRVDKLPKYPDFLKQLRQISQENDLIIQSCCNKLPNIKRGNCIDNKLIEELSGRQVNTVKDKGQRQNCLCAKSRDIGSYNSCNFGCEYCYAIK